MKNVKRRQLINELNKLEINHCQGCQKRKHLELMSEKESYCIKVCEIGKMIQGIGKQLNCTVEEEKETVGPVLTLEAYTDLKQRGQSDVIIGQQFNLSVYQVSRWKKKNGLIDQKIV